MLLLKIRRLMNRLDASGWLLLSMIAIGVCFFVVPDNKACTWVLLGVAAACGIASVASLGDSNDPYR